MHSLSLSLPLLLLLPTYHREGFSMNTLLQRIQIHHIDLQGFSQFTFLFKWISLQRNESEHKKRLKHGGVSFSSCQLPTSVMRGGGCSSSRSSSVPCPIWGCQGAAQHSCASCPSLDLLCGSRHFIEKQRLPQRSSRPFHTAATRFVPSLLETETILFIDGQY